MLAADEQDRMVGRVEMTRTWGQRPSLLRWAVSGTACSCDVARRFAPRAFGLGAFSLLERQIFAPRVAA
jgi:hypothetical protein